MRMGRMSLMRLAKVTPLPLASALPRQQQQQQERMRASWKEATEEIEKALGTTGLDLDSPRVQSYRLRE